MFLDDFLTTINAEISTYTLEAYQNMANTISPLMISIVTLYIGLQGLQLIWGKGDRSAVEWGKHSIKISVVTLLALNWGFFSLFVVDVVTKWPDVFIGSLVSGGDSSSMTALFTELYNNASVAIDQIINRGGWSNPWLIVVGVIGYLANILLMVVIFLLLVSADVLICILLVIAPAIVPLYIFGSTQNICMGWVRALITAMIIPLLVYATSGLFINVLQNQVDALSKAEPTSADIFSFVIITLICCLFMKQIPFMAQGIGSGVASDMGGTYGLARRAARGAARAGYSGMRSGFSAIKANWGRGSSPLS